MGGWERILWEGDGAGKSGVAIKKCDRMGRMSTMVSLLQLAGRNGGKVCIQSTEGQEELTWIARVAGERVKALRCF